MGEIGERGEENPLFEYAPEGAKQREEIKTRGNFYDTAEVQLQQAAGLEHTGKMPTPPSDDCRR